MYYMLKAKYRGDASPLTVSLKCQKKIRLTHTIDSGGR